MGKTWKTVQLTEDYLDQVQFVVLCVGNFSLSDRLRNSREMVEQMLLELRHG